jgi:50S ribosomal subunit-associated GTPase HflX
MMVCQILIFSADINWKYCQRNITESFATEIIDRLTLILT